MNSATVPSSWPFVQDREIVVCRPKLVRARGTSGCVPWVIRGIFWRAVARLAAAVHFLPLAPGSSSPSPSPPCESQHGSTPQCTPWLCADSSMPQIFQACSPVCPSRRQCAPFLRRRASAVMKIRAPRRRDLARSETQKVLCFVPQPRPDCRFQNAITKTR